MVSADGLIGKPLAQCTETGAQIKDAAREKNRCALEPPLNQKCPVLTP